MVVWLSVVFFLPEGRMNWIDLGKLDIYRRLTLQPLSGLWAFHHKSSRTRPIGPLAHSSDEGCKI